MSENITDHEIKTKGLSDTVGINNDRLSQKLSTELEW